MITSIKYRMETRNAWEIPAIGARKRVKIGDKNVTLTVNYVHTRRTSDYTPKRVDHYVAEVVLGEFHDL